MKDPKSNPSALLALCCALTYETPESLRAAAIKIEDSVVYFYYYFNGEVSEDDQDTTSCVSTNALGGFSNVTCEELFIRKDFPEPLPDIGIYAFSRDTIIPKSVSRAETLNYVLEAQAVLSICQALFGKVSSKLRAAGVNKTDNGLQIHFLLDIKTNERDLFLTHQAAQEVVADFPEIKVDIIIEECPYPQKLPELERYAYYRKEQ
jgi:hypothetical protein